MRDYSYDDLADEILGEFGQDASDDNIDVGVADVGEVQLAGVLHSGAVKRVVDIVEATPVSRLAVAELQHLVVLLPGERHVRRRGGGGPAGQDQVLDAQGDLGLGLLTRSRD